MCLHALILVHGALLGFFISKERVNYIFDDPVSVKPLVEFGPLAGFKPVASGQISPITS